MTRPRFLPDNFTLALLIVIALASVLPCRGETAQVFDHVTNVGVALLFFLHGAKLSRDAVIAGLTHWRLHLVVLLCTFALFPVLGLVLKPALLTVITPDLYLGVLFLCTLPSTVQSSIAFTSMARGNVPAAVCSASASNMAGIFLTPMLVGLMVMPHTGAAISFDSFGKIVLQLLLPFVLGQIARRWIGGWVSSHPQLVRPVDQGSILLVVYTAFSQAVVEGIWQQVPLSALIYLLLISSGLLALILVLTTVLSRRLGFNKEDEITIVFCGSKKSLASGVPIAKVLFTSQTIGMMVLPLMLFHQIQLMVCAVLAQRYAARPQQ
ncbi:bile acid:sodium symporter family protein [Stenotrophobium rhamnosiphilum]|uniref:Bile acid:sodium symporter n=1 Tax=Stenotrophobium rhamnosiphilum TaxID=2029166 RepID=A0A2T5MK11_9GAMM|nr:bile acid:sodium symporter family protein [Stenotrophobium rhamnosiphilum]PTU32912.1 bile acid:sodium symporter [Stenotrophobium rhamnosiphilum]